MNSYTLWKLHLQSFHSRLGADNMIDSGVISVHYRAAIMENKKNEPGCGLMWRQSSCFVIKSLNSVSAVFWSCLEGFQRLEIEDFKCQTQKVKVRPPVPATGHTGSICFVFVESLLMNKVNDRPTFLIHPAKGFLCLPAVSGTLDYTVGYFIYFSIVWYGCTCIVLPEGHTSSIFLFLALKHSMATEYVFFISTVLISCCVDLLSQPWLVCLCHGLTSRKPSATDLVRSDVTLCLMSENSVCGLCSFKYLFLGIKSLPGKSFIDCLPFSVFLAATINFFCWFLL